MSTIIVFDRARIGSVEHKISNGNVTSRIKITATFTPKVAAQLGAKWILFDKESLVKDGFKSVELDTEIKNIRAQLEVKNFGNRLELVSESANTFKVVRQGDGKKKPKKLFVQFRIQHAGSPFELLEHLIRVGGAEGALTITPLQKEMFEQEAAANKAAGKKAASAKAGAGANGHARPIPIPSDPDAPEWRTSEEIASGVPHHIVVENDRIVMPESTKGKASGAHSR